MFTHFGVTGPMILSASAHIGAKLAKAPNGELSAYLDLKPALTREQLDARILREFEAGPNKQFKNVISVLFPSSLTPVMLELGGIPAEKKIHDISREERQHFIDLIKAFPFTITGMGELQRSHHHQRRRLCQRDQPRNNGIKENLRALLRRRGTGSGCSDRWI